MRSTTDEELMRGVRAGDAEALERLVRRHGPPLLSFITRMVRDSTEAEDLFQEVWVAVWAKRRSFDVSRRFTPWMYRIAANRCADARRRRMVRVHRTLRLTQPQPQPLPDGAEQEEALAAADAAILTLPEAQREVAVLRLFASLGYAEIARVLGVSESTARSHMSLALRTLRRDLASWVEDGLPAGPKEMTDDRAQAR